MAKGITFNGGFKVMAPGPVGHWDPSQAGTPSKPPKPSHRTITSGVINSDRGPVANGMMAVGTFTLATGSFEVLDNTFPAAAELVLGDFRLVNGVDYVVGAAPADTASAMAAAISKVTGFSATSALAVVTVKCAYRADDVNFYAVHHGGVVSFGNFTGGGYLTIGVPYISHPILG